MNRVIGFTKSLDKSKMDAVQYYRCCLPIRTVGKVENNGIVTELFGKDEMQGMADDHFGEFDILLMSRMYQANSAGFMVNADNHGVKVVFDCDDDLLETYRLISGRGREFKDVLGRMDYVTTTTQYLADLFGQYTRRPPIVLKNCVDVRWMNAVAGQSVPHEKPVIGFSGSPTHWGDWRMASIGLDRAVREFDVRFLVHGFVPRYMKYVDYMEGVELEPLPMIEYAYYPHMLCKFDILLCAVDPTDGFNFGKSDVKALEAMALGIIPICSNFGPYAALKEQGAPVIIVEEETPDCWYETIRSVLKGDMNDDVQGGVKWVLENCDMINGGYLQWENLFRSILDEATD